MNYFELFNTKQNLIINSNNLQTRFYELCKLYHPDATKQNNEESINITVINIAYETLKNFDKRLHYLLSLKQKTNTDEKQILDNAFLMDMLELNETINDYANVDIVEQKKRHADISNMIQKNVDLINKPVHFLLYVENEMKEFDDDEIEQLRNFYLKKKYINRIVAQFEK